MRVAIELAIVMGDDNTDLPGLKCNSASQAPSSPQDSAASTNANHSENAFCSEAPVLVPNSMNMPNSMDPP